MSRLVKVKLALPDGDHLVANRTGIADASGQWEPWLLSISSISRAIGIERTYERGGFTLAIDDVDGAYQAMMASDATRKIYGSVVTVYIYAANDVTVQKTITATIYDWPTVPGQFIVKCVQEFAGKLKAVPKPGELKFTAAAWPDAVHRAYGKVVPMPEGNQYRKYGAITAWCVDDDNPALYCHTWSDPGGAARCSSITHVFISGVYVKPSGYTSLRDANGWELIQISLRRADRPYYITVNGVYGKPSSATQNPVEVLRAVLTDAGVTLVDDGDGGSSDFETWCTAAGWYHNGLTPENIETLQQYLETWAHNFDCFWWMDAAGQVHIKHIDWSSVTANATLTEQMFDDLVEVSSMAEFANRMRVNFNYDPNESEWADELLYDSTAGDYLPATNPVEKSDENVMFAYTVGGAHPVAGKLNFIDRPVYTVDAAIPLDTYEMMALDLGQVWHVTHSSQIGGAGKYLVMREDLDGENGMVNVQLRKLWGV